MTNLRESAAFRSIARKRSTANGRRISHHPCSGYGEGRAAEGVRIQLYCLAPERALVAETLTNADGRTDKPILPKEDFAPGSYELVFFAGDYLKATGQAGEAPMFLDEIPLRFGMADADAHYHVPLLLSAYGYSTYRGS